MILVALNLRPYLTGVGPLAASIRAETGLGLQGLAFLTLLPMLIMGLGAFAGPALQHAWGARRAVLAALALLALGSGLRLFVTAGWSLQATAVLLGLGTAVIQAVFPGVIKARFPARVAMVMGLYACMLMGGGAAGAQLAPIVADHWGGWHAGLAWPALPALLAWGWAAAVLRAPTVNAGSAVRPAGLLKRPRSWLLMACFGLVNGGYASVVAWLAPAYQAQGWSAGASGGLLAVVAASQAMAALALPVCAARQADRRPSLWLTLALQMAGFAGLAFQPQAAPLAWAVLVGAGLGGCFALMMVVALDHFDTPANAGALSALMQGGGFLLAAIAPWCLAVLRQASGGFLAGWVLHMACVAIAAWLVIQLQPAGYACAMGMAPRASSAVSPSPV